MSSEIIIESVSPNGNIEAVVEQDRNVAFFYLRGAPDTEFGVRACWVRNLGPAPEALDQAGMAAGNPPMLPRNQCSHPRGAPALSQSGLRVVWFEEGNAAALLENERPLAVIPGWSGYGGFEGYARDCVKEGPLCWPLSADNVLHERIRAADEFWSSWDGPNNPWNEIQESQVAAYGRQLGAYEKYYAIDGGTWPPKALLRTPVAGGFALTTVGVGLRPQPGIEMAGEGATSFGRIELGIGLSKELESSFQLLAQYLSAQSSLPWARVTWLADGHTVPCDAFPGTAFSAVLLVADAPSRPRIDLPSFRGADVTLVWLLPITEKERQVAVDHGSAALKAKLLAAGVSWLARKRQSVVP